MKKYLVTYDITSDRLRRQLAQLLLQAGGKRVQYSVFVIPLDGAQAFRHTQQQWQQLLAQHPERHPQDSLLAVAIAASALQQAYLYPHDDLLTLPHESSIVI